MTRLLDIAKPLSVLAFVFVAVAHLTTAPGFDTGVKINRFAAACGTGNAVIGCR